MTHGSIDDSTLGGYLQRHDRPPAFEGSDGEAYSVAIWVDDEPGPTGRYRAALLFIRWSRAGDRPVGHLETHYLSEAATAEEAQGQLRTLTLHDVKARLEEAIREGRDRPAEW